MKKKDKKASATHDVYIVFRTIDDKTGTTITGDGVTAAVQGDSLVISVNGTPNIIFGPQQWVSVNTPPNQAMQTANVQKRKSAK